MVIRGINFDRSRYCPYYAPAMVHLLADRLQPMELANRCKVIEFKMTIGECGRIAEIVEKELAGLERKDQPIDWKAAPVEGKLEFSLLSGTNTLPAMQGYVFAKISTVCQRCLEPFKMALETPIKVVFTNSEAAGKQDELLGYDIWELGLAENSLLDIVEESIVMGFPLAPSHDSTECYSLVEAEGLTNMARPFVDLRSEMDKVK